MKNVILSLSMLLSCSVLADAKTAEAFIRNQGCQLAADAVTRVVKDATGADVLLTAKDVTLVNVSDLVQVAATVAVASRQEGHNAKDIATAAAKTYIREKAVAATTNVAQKAGADYPEFIKKDSKTVFVLNQFLTNSLRFAADFAINSIEAAIRKSADKK